MAKRRIEGARVLITGASQGIGRALAEAAAARRQGHRCRAIRRSACGVGRQGPRPGRKPGNAKGGYHRRRRPAPYGGGLDPAFWRHRHLGEQCGYRRHRSLCRRRTRSASKDHGSEFLRPDRDDPCIPPALAPGQQARHRQHLVNRRQAGDSREERVLGKQVRSPGVQRSAAPKWPRMG